MARWTGKFLVALALAALALKQRPPLLRILDDRQLFGPDIAAVLRMLPAFSAAGEKQVMVFNDRVAGTRQYPSMDEAERAVSRLRARSIGNLQPVEWFDDRAIHLAAQLPDARFLAPRLRLDVVEKRLGAWEKHQYLVIDDGSDLHPTVLDLYWYEGGAVIFATREGTVDPRTIERVYLDVAKLKEAGL